MFIKIPFKLQPVRMIQLLSLRIIHSPHSMVYRLNLILTNSLEAENSYGNTIEQQS